LGHQMRGLTVPSLLAQIAGAREDGNADLLEAAFSALLAVLEPDISPVLGRTLQDKRLVPDVRQDVRVLLFVKLPRFVLQLHSPADVEAEGREKLRRWATNLARNYLPRFVLQLHSPADVEAEGREKLRRWATNLARNYARNVNGYGLEIARGWVLSSSRPGGRRRRPCCSSIREDDPDREMIGLFDGDLAEEVFVHRAFSLGRKVVA